MSVNEILNSALELPINERLKIADLLTNSFNKIDDNIQNDWLAESNARLELIKNNKSNNLTYDEFFVED